MKNEKLSKTNFMRNKRAFILATVMCMGIGFAYLSSNLTITGNTNVSGNKWSIYFNKVDITEGSVEATVAPTVSGTTTTSIDYTVLLDKPGDFYEFTVEAKNDGTIDAKIKSILMPALDTDVEKYLSYTATYLDGSPLSQNDILKKKSSATYKVRVEFKTTVSASDLSEEGVNLNLTFGVNYDQYTPVVSNFAKLVKNNALLDSGIDFTQISSDENGKGLYVKTGTENDTYPIYYYRGAVTNNNAKFAGFCWKIVRTTETGGTKLLYNGVPDGNGDCTNATGTSTQLSTTTAFNNNKNSLAYNGYMYGTVYETFEQALNSSDVYGKSFTYTNGTYTLTDSKVEGDDTHHYTCFNQTGTCAQLYYVYHLDSSKAYYITLQDGKSISDAIHEMQTNTTNSAIKTVVDNWFNNTFKTYFTGNSKDYNDYLEDTIWCDDRSFNTLGSDATKINHGWNPDGGSMSNNLWYSSYGRIVAGTPSLTCSNKNDSFTVEESSIGNGALTYPVGLLTTDEIVLAGGQLSPTNENNTYYLYTNSDWLPLSPYSFGNGTSVEYNLTSSGYLYVNVLMSNGVRPSISIAPSVKIASGGDGTAEAPYEFVVE